MLNTRSRGERLHRVLGPIALTSLGVGATIGAGIYVLTGEVAHNWIRLIVWLSLGLIIDFAYSRYHTKARAVAPPRGTAARGLRIEG